MKYGMFTAEGDMKVKHIVAFAIAFQSDWWTVEEELVNLSKQKGFGEAMDTAVREAVWVALYENEKV